MTVYMMYPWWQRKGTNLAANWCSKRRRLDVLPWMAPAWLFVSWHEHGVLEKCVRSTLSTPSFWKWQLFLDDSRCFQGGETDNFKWKSSSWDKRNVSWGWTYGREESRSWEETDLSPSELLIVHIPKSSEAHQSHRLSQSVPGMSPGRNRFILIILDHWFSIRWYFACFSTPRGHSKCLETLCC